MKQHAKWDAKEVDQKAKPNASLASETLPCRVAWLRKWRNIYTGRTCQQTTAEFARSKKISPIAAQDLVQRPTKEINGWKHEAKIRRVIQGNAVEWLTSGPVRNGSKSLQSKEKISSAWDHSISILALHAKGYGIKRIAKDFKTSPRAVLLLLAQSGINTSARRNYGDRNEGPRATLTGSRRSYDRRMANDAQRIRKRLMSRIWAAMKRQRVNGSGTFALVGCSAEQLRDHLLKRFLPGMSFENYGEWHVDHIRPCASFDLNDPEQLKTCFNWRNLQPLWAVDNIRKGASYAEA